MQYRPKIHFEDSHLLIIEKEAGILTVADRFNIESVHVQSMLRKYYDQIYTVHRLDRDTSGLLCLAKTPEAHRALSMMFESRNVEKYYYAIVDGNIEEAGEINSPLTESERTKCVMKIAKKGGKEALTTYEVISNSSLLSLLKVRIHTGRMHQIRVHFASIGHPLFVDAVYGRREQFLLSELKGRKFRLNKEAEEELPLIKRHSLHACRLKFLHPMTEEWIDIESELPKDMKALMHQANKYSKK